MILAKYLYRLMVGAYWCNHPAVALVVEKEQTASPIDEDFDRITYHLLCSKCGNSIKVEHAKTVNGVENFLKSKPKSLTPVPDWVQARYGNNVQ